MIPFLNMSLPDFISGVGYFGVFIMVFLESGVPIGLLLPLPGDTLLFSGGILAAAGAFDLVPLVLVIVVAAILGDSAGYWFGAKFGPKLFTKDKALILNKAHLARAEAFYAKYGRGALILARFMPFVRTFAPIVAGIVCLMKAKDPSLTHDRAYELLRLGADTGLGPADALGRHRARARRGR